MVQRLTLHFQHSRGPGSIPDQETRSLMLRLKSPQVTVKIEGSRELQLKPAQSNK